MKKGPYEICTWKSLLWLVIPIGCFLLAKVAEFETLKEGLFLYAILITISALGITATVFSIIKRQHRYTSIIAQDRHLAITWDGDRLGGMGLMLIQSAGKAVRSNVVERVYQQLQKAGYMEKSLDAVPFIWLTLMAEPVRIRNGVFAKGSSKNNYCRVEYQGANEKATQAIIRHEIAHTLLTYCTKGLQGSGQHHKAMKEAGIS